MITAAIIDDEENNIGNLSSLLQTYCKEVSIITTACSAVEGAFQVSQKQPDLVFLDIEMPEKNGFQMLTSLASWNFEVIFVTAFDQYGKQAIKFAALDYLLKPIDPEELQVSVNKAAHKIRQKNQNLQLENLIGILQKPRDTDDHKIALPAIKETRFVRTKDIIRCESTNSYTSFYLASGEKLTVAKSILEYEEVLKDYHFIRCHQSHLVNKRYIMSWKKVDGDFLLLEDKTRIPVSRHRRDYVKEALKTVF